MGENIVLALLVVLPGFFTYLLYQFGVRKGRGGCRPVAGISRVVTINIVVFLLFFSLFALGAECYYRFVYDATDSFALTKTTRQWIYRHYHLNGIGVRDNTDDYSLKKDHRRIRITFLGDSLTAGHGIRDVNDRFVNRIRRDCPECEIHAFAFNGYDTGREIAFVQRLLESGYEFNIVVLVYCLNDVADIQPEWQAAYKRIFIEGKPGWITEHSYAASVLHYRFLAAREPDILDYFRSIQKGYQGDVWAQQKIRLRYLQQLVESGGGRLAVVTFPFLHALGPQYPYKEIHRRLNDFWTSIKVPHLDLYDTFAAYQPSDLMVNAHDAHPNEHAQRIAAERIQVFLREQFPN